MVFPLARAILGCMDDCTPTTATPPGRVLVVDDEQPLAQMVASYLIRAGFDTRQAHTGTQAVDEARRFSPDVVVLDLGLPELDGLEVCRRIRTFSDCYILMLTARGSEDDKISGLTLGADDYITKPFSIRELVTRVHAVLRRPRTSTTPPQVTTPLIVGDLILDPVAHQVRVGGDDRGAHPHGVRAAGCPGPAPRPGADPPRPGRRGLGHHLGR